MDPRLLINSPFQIGRRRRSTNRNPPRSTQSRPTNAKTPNLGKLLRIGIAGVGVGLAGFVGIIVDEGVIDCVRVGNRIVMEGSGINVGVGVLVGVGVSVGVSVGVGVIVAEGIGVGYRKGV